MAVIRTRERFYGYPAGYLQVDDIAIKNEGAIVRSKKSFLRNYFSSDKFSTL